MEHDITLLSFADSPESTLDDPKPGIYEHIETVHLPQWKSWLQALIAVPTRTPIQIAYYWSREFREAVARLSTGHDLVLAHLIRTAPYASELDDIPKILEMTDALSLTYERVRDEATKWSLKSLVYRLEVDRVQRFEHQSVRQFDLVSLVSSADRDHLQRELAEKHNISVYPNGVEVDEFSSVGSSYGPVVAFVGNMRTAQNQDACDYFIDKVLPRLRQEVLDFQFRIIGASPASVAAKYRSIEGVDFVGEVDHITDAVQGACAGVCPMRVGAGLQNKVLEYMAMELPAVVSPMGLEGIEAAPGKQVLVSESASEMVDDILQLYRDEEYRTSVGCQGRLFVENHHQWECTLAPLVEDIDQLLAEYS
ncbi:glycosyltransferase [Salinibacter ruber]|uniref:glycosyltransferase n=1 Tax=Salinibacter ruber TaxID=146919 RepID=UPI00244FB758|nr:glycosyltransferase involved in cell wall biosynthesis [Salinibacter ruber]